MTALKPCPFCGDKRIEYTYKGFCPSAVWVKCHGCGVYVKSDKLSVTSAWNRRVSE